MVQIRIWKNVNQSTFEEQLKHFVLKYFLLSNQSDKLFDDNLMGQVVVVLSVLGFSLH